MDWRTEEALKEHDYALSMFIQSLCEIEGMKADNEIRKSKGEAPSYGEKEFLDVANRNGMNHNDSISRHIR